MYYNNYRSKKGRANRIFVLPAYISTSIRRYDGEIDFNKLNDVSYVKEKFSQESIRRWMEFHAKSLGDALAVTNYIDIADTLFRWLSMDPYSKATSRKLFKRDVMHDVKTRLKDILKSNGENTEPFIIVSDTIDGIIVTETEYFTENLATLKTDVFLGIVFAETAVKLGFTRAVESLPRSFVSSGIGLLSGVNYKR